MTDVKILATGLGFPEGPVACADGSVVLTEIRNAKQNTFVPFLQRPTLLALLLPGGGIGLTSIIEYLYN